MNVRNEYFRSEDFRILLVITKHEPEIPIEVEATEDSITVSLLANGIQIRSRRK